MSVVYGILSKVASEITDDISNNNGTHNSFIVVTDSEDHYPDKVDPVILRYDANEGEWIFVADKTIVNFGYLTETLEVKDNDVFLTKEPLDKVIWDVFILDEQQNIIKTVNPRELLLDQNFLSGLDDYKGKTLSLMYAFGDKEDSGEIVPVDIPVQQEYLNETVDELKYDGPYDMNDILKGFKYPPPFSSFDRQLLERIKELEDVVNSYNKRMLYTTERLLIEDNRITLPYKNVGTIVHDMALIYMTDELDDTMVALEVTCGVSDGILYFDVEDELNGLYAVVTYLADMNVATIQE